MSKPIIHCHNLRKTYWQGKLEVPVLLEVDLALQAGECIAIVGASGSGKSTLLHLLGGLDQATSGEVMILGQAIQGMGERQKSRLRNQSLGFVYQFHHLLPEFSALENVAMPLLIRRMNVEEAHQKSRAMLDRVGLAHRYQHKPGELSGGERQRVAIARALVTEPVCVLADEPTGNLDRATAQEVFGLMLTLNKTMGTSLIIVTHDIELANKTSKVFQLRDGRLFFNINPK